MRAPIDAPSTSCCTRPGGADAFEDDRRTRESVVDERLLPDLVDTSLPRVGNDVGAEPLAPDAALRVEVHDDDRFDPSTGEGRDRGEPDCSCPDDDRDFAGLDVRAPHVELADGEGVDDRNGVVRRTTGAALVIISGTTMSSPKLPWASGCWPMIRTPLKSTSPFAPANRTGIDVTLVPIGNWSPQPGPCPTTSPTNS